MPFEWRGLAAAGLPAACTALGAAAVFLLPGGGAQPHRAGAQRALWGFAAGVMLAASVFSLLLPAVERAEAQGTAGWLPAAAGFCLGALALLGAEDAADRLLAAGETRRGTVGVPPSSAARRGRRMLLAVTLHNLPEGMVVGLALAAQNGPEREQVLAGALALSAGIGLQNLPEGAAVSLPLVRMGRSRTQAFWCGVASGLVEPLGAALAFGLAGVLGPAMPGLMAAAAGAMVCVAVQELIPAAAQEGRAGVLSLTAGFALMMALDLAL